MLKLLIVLLFSLKTNSKIGHMDGNSNPVPGFLEKERILEFLTSEGYIPLTEETAEPIRYE
jgi:hypothetical protein